MPPPFPPNDALNEGNEQAEFIATYAYAYACGCGCGGSFAIDPDHEKASVTIEDDDEWEVGVNSANDALIEMDEQAGSFYATRSGGGDTSYGIEIDFTMGGDATRFDDYQLVHLDGQEITGNTLEIPAGSTYVEFELRAKNDLIDETLTEPFWDDAETAIFQINNATTSGCGCGVAYDIDPSDSEAQMTITDDDHWLGAIKRNRSNLSSTTTRVFVRYSHRKRNLSRLTASPTYSWRRVLVPWKTEAYGRSTAQVGCRTKYM